MTEQQKTVMRAILVGGVLAARGEGYAACLAEVHAREIGPTWAREWLREHPADAAELAQKTVIWVGRERNRKANPEDQRAFWAARCAARVTVLDVSRAAKVSPGWVHQVEQGEIEATRAQMLVLWGLL